MIIILHECAVSAVCKAKTCYDEDSLLPPQIILTSCKCNSVISAFIYIWWLPYFACFFFFFWNRHLWFLLVMWEGDSSYIYRPHCLMHLQCKLPHSLCLIGRLIIVKCWNFIVIVVSGQSYKPEAKCNGAERKLMYHCEFVRAPWNITKKFNMMQQSMLGKLHPKTPVDQPHKPPQ